MGMQIEIVWHFSLCLTNTAFKPALGQLHKKHPVCIKIRLSEIQNRKFFWGGAVPPPQTLPAVGPHPLRRLRRLDPRAYRSHTSFFRKRSLLNVRAFSTCRNRLNVPLFITNLTFQSRQFSQLCILLPFFYCKPMHLSYNIHFSSYNHFSSVYLNSWSTFISWVLLSDKSSCDFGFPFSFNKNLFPVIIGK